MSKLRSRRTFLIATAAALVPAALVLAFFASQFADAHVRHYTGLDDADRNCFRCHVVGYGGTIGDRLVDPTYRSPLHLAVSPDGKALYATASQGDALLIVDLERGDLEATVPVGRKPHSVVVAPDGQTAYVSNEDDDTVSVVDLPSRREVARLPTGKAPSGLALSRDGTSLFVANWFGDDLSVLDVESGAETRRLATGCNPYGAALTADGRRIIVTSQLSRATEHPDPPETELTIIDATEPRVLRRARLRNAHLVEGVAVAPAGDLALVTLVRPKNLIPAVQVARGWMVTNGLGVVDLETGAAVQVLLDDPRASYADPCDVVLTPDGKLAFVSHSGVDRVTVVDVDALRRLVEETGWDEAAATRLANDLGASRRFVRARLRTGANPKGLAVAPDGTRVYVAERLADRIAVIDVERLEVTGTIDVSTTRHETVVRRGERLFNSASHTFQGQFSCRSCHPNNHVDRLQYDFEPDGVGLNILDNRSLLGIQGTAPFKWNGKNTSMYMQCGMRFATFLTRVEPFGDDDLNALVAFLRSLRNGPNRFAAEDGSLTAAQERGRALFERDRMHDGTPIAERDRCITCHPPPMFTDRKKADVGSSSPTDTIHEFDTPHLLNIHQSPPYLHDGKARTLEEIWTRFNPDDTHGITVDFSKRDLNDLIEYLKTL